MKIRIHSILLADEPTGNLDSKRRQSETDFLREPNSRRRIICPVTHHERFARDAHRTSNFRRKGREIGKQKQKQKQKQKELNMKKTMMQWAVTGLVLACATAAARFWG